jgi:SAM-dependent methyltransferase
MGFYDERVLPYLMNFACGSKSSGPERARVCQGLQGDVVEIGFGSGHNIPYYPKDVVRVAAIDPAGTSWQLASNRMKSTNVPVQWSGLDGESLPFPDASYDSALSTFTLCTIPDANKALLELRRVLKPGGTFHFLEHGLSPDESIQQWQRRLEPINKRVLGGCHLTRPIVQMISDAGFTVVDVDAFYEKGAPKFAAAISLGVATSS